MKMPIVLSWASIERFALPFFVTFAIFGASLAPATQIDVEDYTLEEQQQLTYMLTPHRYEQAALSRLSQKFHFVGKLDELTKESNLDTFYRNDGKLAYLRIDHTSASSDGEITIQFPAYYRSEAEYQRALQRNGDRLSKCHKMPNGDSAITACLVKADFWGTDHEISHKANGVNFGKPRRVLVANDLIYVTTTTGMVYYIQVTGRDFDNLRVKLYPGFVPTRYRSDLIEHPLTRTFTGRNLDPFVLGFNTGAIGSKVITFKGYTGQNRKNRKFFRQLLADQVDPYFWPADGWGEIQIPLVGIKNGFLSNFNALTKDEVLSVDARSLKGGN